MRRADEPRSAAFQAMAGEDTFVGAATIPIGEDLDDHPDCQVTFRMYEGNRRQVPDFTNPDARGNVSDDGDSDYEPETSDEDEVLEYDSEAENGTETIQRHDDGMGLDESNEDDDESEADKNASAWIADFWNQAIAPDLIGKYRYEDVVPETTVSQPWYRRSLRSIIGNSRSESKDTMFPFKASDECHHGPQYLLGAAEEQHVGIEHIAGPGCESTSAYNGHKISAEEMFGCSTLQCLARKSNARYEQGVHDEDFEVTGAFFLTGLSDHMPSRDIDSPTVYPARHGCSDPNAENCLWDEDRAREAAMPFHPPCLEIYKRASLLKTGCVDIDGLTGWYTMEAEYGCFDSFPRHDNVEKCREQWWEHVRGTEYLAANPLFIPDLSSILGSAVSTDPAFDVRNGAFGIPQMAGGEAATADAFTVLPHELRLLLLSFLESKDIANLRLVSRSFRQLPIALWRHLILSEMPWLWEAWTDVPYAGWTTATSHELKDAYDRTSNERDSRAQYIKIVKEEMPEVGEQLEEANRAFEASLGPVESEHSRCPKPFPATKLPPQQTNWYKLYCDITRHWESLKGLQNRQRIWTDCVEILRRIDRYRELGYVPAHGSISIQDVKRMVRDGTIGDVDIDQIDS